MTKAELRTQYLAQRRALSAKDVEKLSTTIAGNTLAYAPVKELISSSTVGFKPKMIHVFLPIVQQNEVNTWPIIHRIWGSYVNVQIVVSVTDMSTRHLLHYELTPDTALLNNRWGIPEPVVWQRQPVRSESIDLILVPLLAFDQQGHRVGYGGGFYDRFLAECRPDCLKVGLSLFEPVERIDEVEITDVRLDKCVTPQSVYSFMHLS
ncbi:5-formyltetrahydrofolate cyclo-ligase [Spirosoma soli]|uniref:5-formyltetrahydrofolate cyclo-ligase n=1 Tax=Spirosoma soli TaxID=1770529 RepID=A0ABW5M7H2_9BACT